MADKMLEISVVIIVISLIIALLRFIKGPGSVSRVVAFDVMGYFAISLIALAALFSDRVIYLDAALIYGLLAFLEVVIFARYIERGL